MAAFEVLRAYLSARATFAESDFELMRGLFVVTSLRAGDYVHRAGEPARVANFVTSGCLRSYVIDGKGVERIVQFAPEQWWLTDIESLRTGQPSQYFFDAIEDS